MRRRIWFDGICLSVYGLWISGDYTEAMPERAGEYLDMPGRGPLWLDGGYWQPRDIIYPAFVVGNMPEKLQALRRILGSRPGYLRIEDDYHRDEYRLGRYVSGLGEGASFYRDAAQFDLTFHVEAERYLKSDYSPLALVPEEDYGIDGLEVTTNPTELQNPTGMVARPLFRVYYGDKTQSATLTVGGTVYTLSPCGEDSVYIDCRTRSCYGTDGGSLGQYVRVTESGSSTEAADFSSLGDRTTVTRGTNCQAVQVWPRWWRI